MPTTDSPCINDRASPSLGISGFKYLLRIFRRNQTPDPSRVVPVIDEIIGINSDPPDENNAVIQGNDNNNKIVIVEESGNHGANAHSSLFTFLSENIDNLRTDGPTLKAFEQLTADCCKHTDDWTLLQTLKNHGWTGTRFSASPLVPLDANSLFLAFLNMHLRKTNSMSDIKVERQISFGQRVANEQAKLEPKPKLPLTIDGLEVSSSTGSRETVVSMHSIDLPDPRKPQLSSKSSDASMLSGVRAPSFRPLRGHEPEEDSSNADHVKAFLPNLLLSHLSRRPPQSILGVSCSTFEGACMLADISGFSKFSGSMCSKGLAGLDDLHTATNAFLGHFVDIVYRYRGDGEWVCLLRKYSSVCTNYYVSPP
jgi:hypothetical protein